MTHEPTQTTTDPPTVLEQFYEKHGADRKRLRLDRFEDAGEKQRLVMLRDEGFVTPLQCRALAKRMDDLGENPLETALAELADGSLAVRVQDPKAKAGMLRLSELREKKPGSSKKQELIDLREAGSITPGQVRQGAEVMTRNPGLSTEQVLIEIGAEHLLDNMPEAFDGGGDAADAGEGEVDPDGDVGEAVEGGSDEGSGDDSEGEGGSSESAPDTSIDASSKSGPPLTLATFLDKSVQDILTGLTKIKSKPAAVQLIVLEEGGKTRTSLMPALKEHAMILGATKEEIESALDIAAHGEVSPAEAYAGTEDDAEGDPEEEPEEE